MKKWIIILSICIPTFSYSQEIEMEQINMKDKNPTIELNSNFGKLAHEIISLRNKISEIQKDKIVKGHLNQQGKTEEYTGLGEIKFSLLTEAQFQNLYGKNWVLMKGQTIQNSDLAFLGWSDLPDARGKFFRMVGTNSGSLGQPQNYATAIPHNPFTGDTSEDSHSHELTIEKHTVHVTAVGTNGPHPVYHYNTEPAQMSEDEHNHSVEITDGGDIETRPTNIAINVFVYLFI